MATKSKFSDVLSKIAFVIAVLLTLFQSYTALFGVLTAVYQRAIHRGLASSYIFLFNMANPKEKGKVFHIIINFIGLVASAGSNFYICLHYAEIQGRLGITTELDMIFGALLLVAILIMGYESLGWALPTISVIFLLYGLFGHLIPEELVWDLDQNTGTVPLQRVSTNGTSVIQILQDQQSLLNDTVALLPLHMGYKTYTTGVVFVRRVIQTLALGYRRFHHA